MNSQRIFVSILILCIRVLAKHPFYSLASNTSTSDLFDSRFVLLLQTPGIYAISVATTLRRMGHAQEYKVFPTLYNAPAIWNLEDVKHQRLAASITSSSSKQMFVEPAYYHPKLYSLAHTSKEQLIIVLQDPIYSYLPLLRKQGCSAVLEASNSNSDIYESMSRIVVGKSSAYMSSSYHTIHERAMKLIRHMRWLPVIRERREDSLRVLRSLFGNDFGKLTAQCYNECIVIIVI